MAINTYGSGASPSVKPKTAMQTAVAKQKAAIAAGNAPSRADVGKSQLEGWYAQEAARKAATEGKVGSITSKAAADKAAAITAYTAKNKAAMEAARAATSKPVSGVATFNANSLKPLQQVTGVAVNDAFAGGNNATDAFYVNPQSTQSQYAVGAPVGGGDIGTRQRATTTAALTPTTDTLGSKRKDQF